jgi:hypothetical protein
MKEKNIKKKNLGTHWLTNTFGLLKGRSVTWACKDKPNYLAILLFKMKMKAHDKL